MKTRIITAFVALGLVVLMTSGIFAATETQERERYEGGLPQPVKIRGYTVEYAEGAVVAPSEIGTIEIQPYPVYSKVKIAIEPSKQITQDGTASYKIIVQDFHQINSYPCEEGEICIKMPSETFYTYELSFVSKQNIKGILETKEISLGAGQSQSIELKVSVEEKGSYIFQVNAEGEDSKDVARGFLLYEEDGEEPEIPASFFVGEGFALSEDETKGMPVKLTILKKDEALQGKINLGKENLKIEGTVSGNNVKFKIFDKYQEEEIGTFIGTIKKFETFLLLRGKIRTDNGETWNLTAMGQKENTFREIEMEKVEIGESQPIQDVQIDEVISVTKQDSEDEVYVRPVKISKEKILKIIPNPWGKKVLEVEVIEDGKTTTKTIKAFESTKTKNYEISVGSLEDQENLEIGVSQTA